MDVVDDICAQALAITAAPSEQFGQRLATCFFGVLLEAARSYAERPALRGLVAGLVSGAGSAAGPGVAGPGVAGPGGAGATEQVATATAVLAHALLRDDSYRTALHPGQLVVPVAMAVGQETGADGAAILAAAGVGYEVGCRFADQLLPEMADRGWRASAVVSPVAAAATAVSLLRPGDTAALASAVRLAGTVVGGPLHTIAEGDDWQVQPALLIGAGISAARLTAAGHVAATGHLDRVQGVFEQLLGSSAPRTVAVDSRIDHITFKSHAGPMFAQSLLRAVDELADTLLAGGTSMVVTMAPFAVSYAGGSQSGDSVVSIERIVRDRLAALSPDRPPSDVAFELRGDPAVTDLDVLVEVRPRVGDATRKLYLGDTTSWKLGDVLRTVSAGVGAGAAAEELAAAVLALGGAPGLDQVVDRWRALAAELAVAAGNPISGGEELHP